MLERGSDQDLAYRLSFLRSVEELIKIYADAGDAERAAEGQAIATAVRDDIRLAFLMRS